jgi:hypothetical protein
MALSSGERTLFGQDLGQRCAVEVRSTGGDGVEERSSGWTSLSGNPVEVEVGRHRGEVHGLTIERSVPPIAPTTALLHRGPKAKGANYASPMDLEHFYESNEARRTSEEHEFGSEWVGDDDAVFQLSWVASTGELYLMAENPNTPVVDGFGDIIATPESASELEVEILGTVDNLDRVHEILAGWEDQCGQPYSLGWLRSALAEGGVRP